MEGVVLEDVSIKVVEDLWIVDRVIQGDNVELDNDDVLVDDVVVEVVVVDVGAYVSFDIMRSIIWLWDKLIL